MLVGYTGDATCRQDESVLEGTFETFAGLVHTCGNVCSWKNDSSPYERLSFDKMQVENVQAVCLIGVLVITC